MTDWMKDKVAVVTGGASGIGAATATKLAAEGAAIVVADLNTALGEDLVNRLKESGATAAFVKTDVTRASSIGAMVEQAASLGPIAFLVNSAGKQTYGTVETTDEALWDMTMDVNLKSMYLVSHAVIPHILKAGGGGIVNISSVQGIRSQKNVAAYATSKAGAIALTRTMGLDFASRGIRVNCICPGSVDTPLLREGMAEFGPVEEVKKQWGSQHPVGRIGTPEEIAETAFFLLSPQAEFLVGQPIVQDGGLGSIIL